MPINFPWKWLAAAAAALVIVTLVVVSVRSYGASRYDAGVTATDEQWKAAARELEKQSRISGSDADIPAEERARDWAARLESEKERIDEAIENGDDPFDVMFPGDGLRN